MQTFHSFRRFLCKKYPDYKVSVRRRKISRDSDARCFLMEDGSYLIEIHCKFDEDHAIHLLIHEFAHAIAWNAPLDHGAEWGAAYAEVYSAWEEYLSIPEETTV